MTDTDTDTDTETDSISIDDVAVPPAPPAVDEDTAALVDEMLESIVVLRFPLSTGDARATVHALSSLAAEVAARLPDAVADARDRDSSWEEIAVCLGTSANIARRRYATFVRNRREVPMED